MSSCPDFEDHCKKAEKIALRLIARAEQNSTALKFKLLHRGIDSAAADEVISRLLDRKLLDDHRYAELWLRSCLSKKATGPIWLLASLEKRGIERDSAFKALKKVLDDEEEYNLLLRYLDKMDNLKKKKAEITRKKLKHEGFSSQTLDRYYESQPIA